MSRTSPPALEPTARQAAVAAATEARTHRATVKADLKAGRISLAEVLDGSDPLLDRLPVVELLRALPRTGPTRAMELMASVGIAANRRVGGLGSLQRSALLRLVEQK